MSEFTLELIDDPGAFLAAAAEYLAAEPVLTTVVATVTERCAAADARGLPRGAHPRWWVVVRGPTGAVVGTAMRTAPFAPYPAFALPMPDAAAVELARRVHARGEWLGGVNGALPAARLMAEETARLIGGAVQVHEHVRLFELGELRVPAAPPGRLRPATPDDADLALDWFRAFEVAAAEQSGRTGGHAARSASHTLDDVRMRIDDGTLWFWENAGERVHLTGASLPANGVTRIGPVYTPLPHRKRGYGSAAVAEVARRYLEQGVRVCLFTDQANPTSNKIYEALGFRRVTDMVHLRIPAPGLDPAPDE